jgi:hypothetical protein
VIDASPAYPCIMSRTRGATSVLMSSMLFIKASCGKVSRPSSNVCAINHRVYRDPGAASVVPRPELLALRPS